jgi:hypothetical protein
LAGIRLSLLQLLNKAKKEKNNTKQIQLEDSYTRLYPPYYHARGNPSARGMKERACVIVENWCSVVFHGGTTQSQHCGNDNVGDACKRVWVLDSLVGLF